MIEEIKITIEDDGWRLVAIENGVICYEESWETTDFGSRCVKGGEDEREEVLDIDLAEVIEEATMSIDEIRQKM